MVSHQKPKNNGEGDWLDRITPLASVSLVVVAIFFFAFASSQNEPNLGVKEMALGDKVNVGGYQFLLRDLSSNAAIITVSKDGSVIDPLLLIARGEIRNTGTMQLEVQEILFLNGNPSKARISFSKTQPLPSGTAITQQKAREFFLSLPPQSPAESLSITTGSCRKIEGYCYIVSGYRKFTLQNEQGSTLNFLDGTIAYISAANGELAYAFKTN